MFRKRIAAAGLIAVTTLIGGSSISSPALAQVIDMDEDDDEIVDLDEDDDDSGGVIDLDEDDDDGVAAVAGTPTETYARGKSAFDKKQYGQAAKLFHEVISGSSGDDPGNTQMAEFYLAQSLYFLKFYQASFDLFSGIAGQKQHIKFNETLLWLAKLSLDLPEPADIISQLGKYSEEDLARFDNKSQRSLYWKLNYFLGRYQYRNAAYEEAIKLFARVNSESEDYVKAQFFTGVSYIQLRKSVKAVESFERVEKAVDEGAAVDDAARMRDLARLSMARTMYSASIKLDPETNVPTVSETHLSAAVKYWNQVDESSEYWLDALFEEAWAYYMAGQYTRALGNIHTLKAPYFPKAFYPEADILKSIIYFFNCDYESAITTIARFETKTKPLREKLAAVLKKYEGDNQEEPFYKFLNQVRDGEADLDADIEPLVETALSDRQLLRNIAYVEYLEKEIEQFKKAPPAFQQSAVGTYVFDQTKEARAAGVKKAGSLALSRYQRYIKEMDEHLRNAQKVIIDITAAQRNLLDQAIKEGQVSDADSKLFNVVNPDEEHFMWEFDGEYWRDELGFYRQELESACGR
ncbi:MAG: hypothetical protein MK135_04585 [Polyangiaceae bacterium]|nr:hypothetical protein [Polyangiaceae bacterium]